MKNEIYEWASKYSKYYSIIPVGEDKKPVIEWKKFQTEKPTDEDLKKWFDGETPANIGIVTGKISGITVVDVEEGGEWKHLPRTATVATGGGGYHLYYKYAEGVGNSVRVAPLTDIRGDGGYVVAPPSLHKSGKNYEWIIKEAEQPFPFANFQLKPKERTDWQEIVQGLPQGNRNQTATKFIGKLLQTFAPSEWLTTVWEMVVMWNLRNTPPLPEHELRSTFNSICGMAKRSGSHKQEEETDNDCDIKLISEIANGLEDDITISYPTGYPVYDEAFMGGLKEGDLVVVSGYTGQGKTLLAQSMTYNLIQSGQPTLWFSFEVPVGELWRKFKDMGAGENFLAYSPERSVNRKIDWVTEKIIDSRDRFKTKVIFIDHLGFMAEDPANYDSNLTSNYSTKLTMICRRLKSLAITENVAIVLLAHLRKPMNSNAEPTYHDLKDSSGVAQEADSVIIINRKKDKGGFNDSEIYQKESSIKIEKNRRTGQTKIFQVELQNGRLVTCNDTDEGKKMVKTMNDNIKRFNEQ